MLINSSTHKSIRSHRSWFILFKRQCFFNQVYTRPVNLPHLQILRIDGIRDDKWCHNDYSTWHHLWKKLHKKDVVGIITFDLINWLTSHQPHYCLYYLQWHTRVCEEMFDINSKIAQTKQSIWKNSTVRKLIPQEMANHGDYPQDFRF